MLDQADLEQQLPVGRRQRGDDLGVEVVGDVGVGTGHDGAVVDPRIAAGRTEALPGGQGDQRDAGHPAGRATQHRTHALVRRRDAVQGEDLADLGLGGGEVLRADVGDRAFQPVPEPVHLRVAAGGQDQPERRPGVPGEEVELLRHRGAGEHVGIVEDEHDRLRPAVERGGQPVDR